MNILPFIITSLIIFSCLSLGFLREMKSFVIAETTLVSHAKAERTLHNHLTRKAYRTLKGKNVRKEPKKKSPYARGQYTSARSLCPPLENSKLNLFPLIKAGQSAKTHPLYEPTVHFVQLLYRDKLFPDRPETAYLLVDQLIKAGAAFEKIDNLIDLYPEKEPLKTIYYQALRGTNQYNTHAKQGIPPLADFIYVKEEAPFASLATASPPLLEVLLGTDIATALLREERESWDKTHKHTPFSKENLTALLQNDPNRTLVFNALEPFLDFKKTVAFRKRISAKDPKTGLSVTINN